MRSSSSPPDGCTRHFALYRPEVRSEARRKPVNVPSVHGFQKCRSSQVSAGANPQCAAALDHFHVAGSATIRARTGFNST